MPKIADLPQVSSKDRTPKYIQAQHILSNAIREGRFLPGSKLPPTQEVGTRLNISLITAHKALEAMVEAGWLRREKGRGTFVREDLSVDVPVSGKINVGLLLDRNININDFYHSTIIDGMRRASQETQGDVEFFFHDQFVMKKAGERRAVGLLCFHPPTESSSDIMRLAQRFPVLIIGGALPNSDVHSIDCDNRQGSAMAVDHLLSLGHRRILLLAGPLNLSNSRDRFEGALDRLRGAGIRVPNSDRIVSHDSVVLDEASRQKLRSRLKSSDRPSAIIAGGFYLALGAFQAVRECGLRLPGDLSIVGFDDPASAPLLDPPVTTIRQPLREMAKIAFESIRARILRDKNVATESVNLPTELVVRGSTGPAPKSR